jgi:hypothetical protein
MSRVVPLALLVLAAACGKRREITVQVLVPDLGGVATPIAGVVVAAIPYDRDSVIAAMEARVTTPRPHARTLDSLFHAFHGPFLAFSRAAWAVEQATRSGDSAALARLRPEMERARAELSAARDTLWPRIESLRVEARQWQSSTFAGYDTAARSLARSRMRTLSGDTTDAAGWATLRVAPGPWWITARSPDPQDPNFEWYWNVRADADTLRLDPASGRHLPRY